MDPNVVPPQTDKPVNQARIVDIPVVDENTALNIMVSFLALAQSKGVFTFEESSKIWECINKFKQ
jgi:hypothetical protein